MTAPSLAEELRDATRARILRAAGRVLAARGLAATVDEVAEAAGVNRRTVFRQFATREALIVATVRAGVQRYADQLPAAPENDELRGWLVDVLDVTHRLNARNGRVFWELTGLPSQQLTGQIAQVAAECRESRNRFAAKVADRLWQARRGAGQAPRWLVDAVAVHLSGFTTQALAGDLGRAPEQVAAVSARVIEAALAAALAQPAPDVPTI